METSRQLVEKIINVLDLELQEIRMFQIEGSQHSFEIWVNDHVIDGIMNVSAIDTKHKTHWDDNRYFTETSTSFTIDITEGTYFNEYGCDITTLDKISDASNYLDLINKMRKMIVEEIEKDPGHYYESANGMS